MIIWFLSFILLVYTITLIDLHVLNHPCIPGINPIWSWCMILLMYCWIQFVENFWIYIHQGYWAVIFFYCTVLDWLWYQTNAGWLESGPSSSSWKVCSLTPTRKKLGDRWFLPVPSAWEVPLCLFKNCVLVFFSPMGLMNASPVGFQS